MLHPPATSDFAVAITCAVLVLLVTIYPIYYASVRTLRKNRSQKSSSDHYQDKDGIATAESEKAFPNLRPRLTLLLVSILGVVVSTLFLVGSYTGFLCFLTGDNDSCESRSSSIWIEQCFILLSWGFLLVQSCIIFRTRESAQRFKLGLFGGISSLVVAICLPVEAVQWNSASHARSATNLHISLLLIEFILTITVFLCFLLLPRRPDVYEDGKLVDRQFTGSAFNRYTFGWAGPLLAVTAKTKKINYDDLPIISHDIRATALRADFDGVTKKQKFWQKLYYSHQTYFLTQWGIQMVQSFMQFLPQISLYATLRALEARDEGSKNGLQLWLLVISLGVSDAISMWTENMLYYVCYVNLGARVYEQISTVVFCKAIRKKDVKGVSASKTGTEEEQNNQPAEPEGGDGKDATNEDSLEDDFAKSKQSTINLIGVDGKRISDFTTYNCLLLGCVAKIIIAVSILVVLVDWVPVVAGFAAFLCLIPINYFVARRYHATQDDLMKYRDQKMAVVTEALQGIRQIKFSALEKDWYEKIIKTRKKELGKQWAAFMWDMMLIAIWIFGPICLSGVSLTVYALIHGSLSPSIAFTVVSIFESIEVTLGVAPELLTDLFDCLVSCKRIQDYLESSDRVDEIKPGSSIMFRDATIAWPSDDAEEKDQDGDQFKLQNLNLQFPPGELTVISGRTGSGKSLLLSSIIGEADIMCGEVFVPRALTQSERFDHKANEQNWILDDAIAYVAQIPWIENATIKDNVLFNLPFDETRYKKVLYAAALEKDLEILEDGDLTDIGANGINLSGGQKWRVSFARALYSRAGILVLDDIFSAVDAHVGKHLFEQALTGELGRGRTRVLVTHHVALCLPKTVYSVLLENGTVMHAGLVDELRRDGLLKDILAYDIEEQDKADKTLTQVHSETIDDGGSLQRIMSGGRARQDSVVVGPDEPLSRTKSVISEIQQRAEPPKKFTEDEARATGGVKLAVYKAYISASGGFGYWSTIIAAFLIWSGAYLARSYWVSIWTRSSKTESTTTVTLFQQPIHYYYQMKDNYSTLSVDHTVYYYVGIYLAISMAQWIMGVIKYFFVYVASIRASKKLFEDLTHHILRAPLRFLDTTPLGRILNRFTSDFNMVDSKISYDLMFCMHSVVSGLAVVVAGVFISPYMLLFAVILAAISMWYAARYLAGAREVKRLESNAKSPIFEQFGSVLSGIGTIRAFGKAEEYIQRMDKKINIHCRAYYHLWLFNRWMSLRVSFVGACFITAVAALIVGVPGIDASLAGFALSFSLSLSEYIIWMLRQYANVELDLNAVERIVEYSNMPIEDQSGHDAPAAWPTKGELEVNDLVVSYAPDLQPVLRGLTFSVKQNERVGVVGRTGAGKSSLTLAIFRFLEARSGSIWIDGIDISKIKLVDLRSRLAIIPQDPVLFSGTVRSNLDPFNQHTDSELRDALVRVHLVSPASTIPSGVVTPSNGEGDSSASSTLGHGNANINIFTSLSSKIAEGGLNLSQGQRQLLCLARAIVSRPKILVLDEATSSVDMETDALIQRSIREEFADSTLIVIAHRLSTIADFSRILVLGEGKVLEFDQPAALMARENSAFKDMVESSGERRELESIIKGQQ